MNPAKKVSRSITRCQYQAAELSNKRCIFEKKGPQHNQGMED